MKSDRKSIWIPRVPRTGSVYLTSKLSSASSEHTWRFFKKDHITTEINDKLLTEFDTIYSGHSSYYSDNIKQWIKLLVVRKDVISRFLSSYNYSNYLLRNSNIDQMTFDTYIICHQDFNSEFAKKIREKNQPHWNPFLSTSDFLNFMQRKNNQAQIEDFVSFFDNIYFTEKLDQLVYDLENIYGYEMKFHSDWKIEKNSTLELLNSSALDKSDLSDKQLNDIVTLPAVDDEFKFIETILKKDSNDKTL